ncbi:outer membrane beta-barrel protein [Elizabethkingia ursingii]
MKKIYILAATLISYAAFSQNVQDTTKVKTVETVVLEGKKKLIERKPDRLIFNIGNSVAAAGGTALDALKATPNVKINNDAISIVGKSTVLVLIDDKEVYMNGEQLSRYLEGISAENLSKIEVITTPPAKYSAEGNSGIINIVTKKMKTNSWNANVGSSYQRSRRNTWRSNAAFNLQKDKITLQSSIDLGDRRFLRNWNNDLYYPDAHWENRGITDFKNNYYAVKAALDYKVTERLTLGTKFNASLFDTKNSGTPSFSNIYDSAGALQKYISTSSFQRIKSQQQVYNLYSEYKLDTLGKKITMDLDYVNYNGPGNRPFSYATYKPNNEIVQGSQFVGLNNTESQIQNFSAKIDTELPLKFVNLSFGGRFSTVKTTNDIAAYKEVNSEMVPDTNISNYFRYRENNEALYISGSKKIGKWDLQAGLRMEATQTTGYSRELDSTHKNNYIKLFPTLYAMYSIADKTSISFNYSRRINRPSYESLNPFRTINNSNSYNEGNAFLQPAFTDNVELTFTYKNLDSRVYFSSLKNGISQASLIDPATMNNNFVWMNYVDANSFGLAETFTWKPVKWWSSMNTFNLSHSNTQLSIGPERYKGWTADFSTSNDFTLNKLKTAFFNLTYTQDFGGAYNNFTSKAYSTVDISFKYLAFDKKLVISLVGSNIFNGIGYSYQMMNGVKQSFRNIWDNQSFRVSLNYKFGNDKIKASNRQSGNTEELNRM